MKKLFLAFLVLFGIDQVSKMLFRFFEPANEQILPFFALHTTENSGIAFSLPFPTLPLTILSLGVLAVLAWMLIKKELMKWEKVAFLFIFSGAVGNFMDRILFGSVTDFLSFFSFPIFNFADIWITAGIVMYVWQSVENRRRAKGQ